MSAPLNPVSSPASQPYVPVVSSTAAAALSSQAVSLSGDSAVVALLGGGSSGAGMYTPSGLLDTLQHAGTAAEPLAIPVNGSNVDTSNTAQFAQQQGIVSGLASSPTASGVYTGALPGLPSAQGSANWADLLKANPNLASSVISYSYDFGVVSSLQVTA